MRSWLQVTSAREHGRDPSCELPAVSTVESFFDVRLVHHSDRGQYRAIRLAEADAVDRYNHRRLQGEIGHVPAAEYEEVIWATPQPNHYPETPVLTEAGTT